MEEGLLSEAVCAHTMKKWEIKSLKLFKPDDHDADKHSEHTEA